MPITHEVAKQLAIEGQVVLSQGGKELNLLGKALESVEIRGVYRLRAA